MDAPDDTPEPAPAEPEVALAPLPVEPEGPPDAAPAPAVCLDCGAPRTGAYCQDCGQHHVDDRLTMRVVFREFAERFLKLERGLFATARRALADPGGLARAYVGGARRRYTNPVSFLLIGAAVAVLLIPFYASQERLAGDASMPMQTDAQFEQSLDLGIRLGGGDPADLSPEERAEILAEVRARQEAFFPAYLRTVSQLYSVFSIALALALAAFLKLFFGGRDRTFTYAETLVLGCYVAGVYTAASSVAASLVALVAPILVGTVVASVLLVALVAHAAAGFYERTWGAAALGGLAGLLGLAAYMVAVVVIALPVVALKML